MADNYLEKLKAGENLDKAISAYSCALGPSERNRARDPCGCWPPSVRLDEDTSSAALLFRNVHPRRGGSPRTARNVQVQAQEAEGASCTLFTLEQSFSLSPGICTHVSSQRSHASNSKARARQRWAKMPQPKLWFLKK